MDKQDRWSEAESPNTRHRVEVCITLYIPSCRHLPHSGGSVGSSRELIQPTKEKKKNCNRVFESQSVIQLQILIRKSEEVYWLLWLQAKWLFSACTTSPRHFLRMWQIYSSGWGSINLSPASPSLQWILFSMCAPDGYSIPCYSNKKGKFYNRQKSDFSLCRSFDGSLIWDNIYWTNSWGEGSGIYPVRRFLQGVYKLLNCVKQLLCSEWIRAASETDG